MIKTEISEFTTTTETSFIILYLYIMQGRESLAIEISVHHSYAQPKLLFVHALESSTERAVREEAKRERKAV